MSVLPAAPPASNAQRISAQAAQPTSHRDAGAGERRSRAAWHARLRRLARQLAVDLSLAYKEVWRRRRRSAVAIAAVSFSVLALLLSAGFIEWIFWAMRDGTIRSGMGHIQITRPGYLQSGIADPRSFLLPGGGEDGPALHAVHGIETVAPKLTFNGLISRGESTLSFQGDGVVPARQKLLSKSMQITAGEPLADGDAGPRVLLGEGLARNLGVGIDDAVVLLVSTPHGGVNAVEAKVKGIFATSTKAYDDVAIQMPLALAQSLYRVDGATSWVITLTANELTDPLVDVLRKSLPPAQYEVLPWHRLADFYNKTVSLFRKQLAVLELIIVVIVVLTISNSMMISVLERTSEIGTALALGVTPGVVRRRILVEGFVLGLLGIALGLLGGLLGAQAISRIGIPMPPPPGMSHGYVGSVILTPAAALEAVFIALSSAVVGSILPAIRASRMTIADAIRTGR